MILRLPIFLISAAAISLPIAHSKPHRAARFELSVQSLKDVPALLQTATAKHGRRTTKRFINRTATEFSANDHRSIARALRHSSQSLIDLATARTTRDINHSKTRRVIQRVLRTSLATQPLAQPSAANPAIPFYTLIAVNYASQLEQAYRNLKRGRRLTKGFSHPPGDMLLRLVNGAVSSTASAPPEITYFTNTPSNSISQPDLAPSGTTLVGGTMSQSLSSDSLHIINGSGLLLLGGTLTIEPGAQVTAPGVLIAPPNTESAPTGSLSPIFEDDSVVLNGITNDLTSIPSDPPHSVTSVTETIDTSPTAEPLSQALP